jgi:hypothetical protein
MMMAVSNANGDSSRDGDFSKADASEFAEHHPPGWAPGELPISSRPPRDDKRRWIIALVALAVIVAVGAVLLFTRQDDLSAAPAADNSPKTAPAVAALTSSAPPTIFASAEDTGPLTIITSDETCGPWDNIQTAVAVAQRSGFDAVGNALRSGADDAVTLAAQTPHRAMRALYDAFIVYGRGYAEALPTYQPKDDFLAQAALAALDAITKICAANHSDSAATQAPKLPPVPPPTNPQTLGDPANPQRFLTSPGPTCASWIPAATTLQSRTKEWSALDPNIGVAQWNPEQRAVHDDTARVVTARASDMEVAGRGSGNAVVEDLATLGAVYFRAYATAEPLYWAGDHELAEVGFNVNNLISAACQAAAG